MNTMGFSQVGGYTPSPTVTTTSNQFFMPQPIELGFRIIQVDGGYYINNFDAQSGNAVRATLDEVQTYLTQMVNDKFNPQPNATEAQNATSGPTEGPTETNEIGVETPEA